MAFPSGERSRSDAGFHRLSWASFDAFARLTGDDAAVDRLRSAERSRRKLLLYALLEAAAKTPEQFGPLPPVEMVWELLARVEDAAPSEFERLLAHPYTGSWAGYTTRLLCDRLDGVGPLWIHLGHVHAIAAAAAIRAGLDFRIMVPVWSGNVSLPSLGLARLSAGQPYSVAEIGGGPGDYVISDATEQVRVPARLDTDGPGWWSVHQIDTMAGDQPFSVRLDDIDPYRGLYEPISPQRLDAPTLGEWRRLIGEAWRLLVLALPEYASQLAVGLNSLVPTPRVLFRNPSASTGEAFGSAVLGHPTDGAALAATLVHEFQHIVLGGILHLTPLYEADARERVYVPWRDDPRPLSGAVQGAYAFLGVTAFWRAYARAGAGGLARRSWFEFAYWRGQTAGVLAALRGDAQLTEAGRRFLDGMVEILAPWQQEPIAEDVAGLAAAVAADHRAGWRVRHLRPDPDAVRELADAWLAGQPRPSVALLKADLPPTPVPDGPWSHARADLVRLGLTERGRAGLRDTWPHVPDATAADLAYAIGRQHEAARLYRAELAAEPDRPASLVGLGLSLAGLGPHPAARALVHRPELVRAVHRELRSVGAGEPSPEHIASWLGQLVSD